MFVIYGARINITMIFFYYPSGVLQSSHRAGEGERAEKLQRSYRKRLFAINTFLWLKINTVWLVASYCISLCAMKTFIGCFWYALWVSFQCGMKTVWAVSEPGPARVELNETIYCVHIACYLFILPSSLILRQKVVAFQSHLAIFYGFLGFCV